MTTEKKPEELVTEEQKRVWLRRRFRYTPVCIGKDARKNERLIETKDSSQFDGLCSVAEFKVNFVNLDIQLRTDNISRQLFFRSCIRGMLERDPNMVAFVEEYIKGRGKRKQQAREKKILAKEEKRYETIAEKVDFNGEITEDESKSIFDLIAGEFDLDEIEDIYIQENLGEENEEKEYLDEVENDDEE